MQDFKGRKLTLLATKARKTEGHRYVTRKAIAEIISGVSTFARGGSAAANPVKGWPAHATKTRIRIGCHIFTGVNAQAIREWALGARNAGVPNRQTQEKEANEGSKRTVHCRARER